MEVDEKQGVIELEGLNNLELDGVLIDIKPYFPSEEVVTDEVNKEERYIIDFSEDAGEYRFVDGEQQIILSDHAINESLMTINSGDYIRVFWWFHLFDTSRYRRSRTCNPPYENAPRTGIFATRSPVRPNPLASTIVKVNRVNAEAGRISVIGFDGFENSKIVQVQFYQHQTIKF